MIGSGNPSAFASFMSLSLSSVSKNAWTSSVTVTATSPSVAPASCRAASLQTESTGPFPLLAEKNALGNLRSHASASSRRTFDHRRYTAEAMPIGRKPPLSFGMSAATTRDTCLGHTPDASTAAYMVANVASASSLRIPKWRGWNPSNVVVVASAKVAAEVLRR